jgi:hypothetical protein
MTYAQKYLDMVRSALRARGERDSDNHVAKTLDISRTAVYNWKNEITGIGIIDGYRIALFLDLDPLDVVSDLHKDEFKSPELRQFFSLVSDAKKKAEKAA